MTHRTAHVIGIKPWKRWQIDAFLSLDYDRIQYAFSASAALRSQRRSGGDLVVWAAREPIDLAPAASHQGARLLRMEDGFIRSVGLGSTHVGGASLVIDDLGIHFDPRRPSRLEQLLQCHSFSESDKARARALRHTLIRTGVSKYNVGRQSHAALGGEGRRRILVPGQVENDASVRLGAPDIGGNLGLLKRVRSQHPDAWIIYKPHPDTEARTRPGRVDPDRLRDLADEVIVDVSPGALLGSVDEVHTMTSLMGFEALLRGLPVEVWGRPFYAGWGLTRDHQALPARSRRRDIDELVAAVLIEYPRYVHPQTRLPCGPEDVVEVLSGLGAADSAGQRSTARRYARLGQGLWRSLVPGRR